MTAIFAKQSVHKISINCSRPKGRFFIGVNMDINIYEDFLSKAEIEFLTGRKQKSLVVEQLNAMGIPFKRNANGYPIVRRDYDKVKSRTAKNESQNYENNAWRPSVLQA